MKVVKVKFGGSKGGVDGHKNRLSLEAWLYCDEQKDRQEGLFFNLGRTGREANRCRGKIVCREAKRPFVAEVLCG